MLSFLKVNLDNNPFVLISTKEFFDIEAKEGQTFQSTFKNDRSNSYTEFFLEH